jgi:hypothetical protein
MVVPVGNPRRLTATYESVDNQCHERSLPVGLVGHSWLFRSRAALQAEILILRHQLNVLRRRSPKRAAFSNIDRLVFAGLYGLVPHVLDA